VIGDVKMPRKGWWKPYVSAAVGAAGGLASGLFAGGPTPIGLAGAMTAATAGAKKGYDLHESIREKYNVPWMGGSVDKMYRGKGVTRAVGYQHKHKKHSGVSTPRMGGGGRRPITSKPHGTTYTPRMGGGGRRPAGVVKDYGMPTPRMGKSMKKKKC
jgi:hypothetical protein